MKYILKALSWSIFGLYRPILHFGILKGWSLCINNDFNGFSKLETLYEVKDAFGFFESPLIIEFCFNESHNKRTKDIISNDKCGCVSWL